MMKLKKWLGRLARPAVAMPPPFESCAGCRKAGRDDQQVPEPSQFTKIIGKAKVADLDAAPEPVKEEAIKLIDAAPVRCTTCGAWYHAVGCYSLHRNGKAT